MIIETKRLLLRPILPDDARHLHPVLSDHEHMKHTFHTRTYQQSIAHFSSLATQWQTRSYGVWSICDQASQAVCGWGGITLDEVSPGWGPELVYFLGPDWIGRGYAGEMAEQAVKFAFSTLHLKELSSFTMADNTPSQRLLYRLGFKLLGFEASLDRWHFRTTG